jgi:hypothetical protein
MMFCGQQEEVTNGRKSIIESENRISKLKKKKYPQEK